MSEFAPEHTYVYSLSCGHITHPNDDNLHALAIFPVSCSTCCRLSDIDVFGQQMDPIGPLFQRYRTELIREMFYAEDSRNRSNKMLVALKCLRHRFRRRHCRRRTISATAALANMVAGRRLVERTARRSVYADRRSH